MEAGYSRQVIILETRIFMSTNITCNTTISSQYYSKIVKNLDGYRKICFSCLEECKFAKENPSYIEKIRSFLPRCKDCKVLGKESYTRMQKKTTTRKASSATLSEASSKELTCGNVNSEKVQKHSKHEELKDIEETEEKRK